MSLLINNEKASFSRQWTHGNEVIANVFTWADASGIIYKSQRLIKEKTFRENPLHISLACMFMK